MVSASLKFVVLMIAGSQLPSTEGGGIGQCWGIGEDQRVGLCIANKKLCGPDEVEISPFFSNCDQTQTCCTSSCAGSAIRFGSQCLTFSDNSLNWNDASAECGRRGRRLATLDNAKEVQEYALAKYGSNTIFWVGGTDADVEGSWKWTNGQPFTDQFPWPSYEPNGGPDENCLAVWGDRYNDWICSRKARYICEDV